MSAIPILTRLLLDDPDVTAKVNQRVFGFEIPAGFDLPALVVRLVHEEQDIVLNGANPAFDARLTVECIATSPTEAGALGETVKRALENVRHQTVTTPDSPAETLGTATLFKEGSDLFDTSEDRSVYRRIMDWRLRWIRP